GPDEDRNGVHVELCVDRVRVRNPDDETEDDREVPEDRAECRNREALVAIENSHDDSRDPEQDDDRKENSGKADRELPIAARIAEEADDPRGEQDEERCQAGQHEQHEPEETRGDAPGALPVTPLEQLGEDRDECSGQGEVRDESPEQVRDLERDRERVDLPADSEVVGGDHLADEPHHARDTGGEREDRRRPCEPAAGTLVHAASIGRALNGAPWAAKRLCYHRRARAPRAFSRGRVRSIRARSSSRSTARREPPLKAWSSAASRTTAPRNSSGA